MKLYRFSIVSYVDGWKSVSNLFLYCRQNRLVGYRILLEWALHGERLGRHRRIVLPACIVQAVRQRFPSTDGQYRGFVEVNEAFEGVVLLDD